MASGTERVQRRRATMRAAGLRPIQIWVPNTRAPGFAEACRLQCLAINAFEYTPETRDEGEFWDAITADAWTDLGPYEG